MSRSKGKRRRVLKKEDKTPVVPLLPKKKDISRIKPNL
jgi:hypothetical protein